LRAYHGALGPVVAQFEGTLDQFSGDGIMVFFNDPVPCPDPAERAVKMAVAMREAARALNAKWRRRGRELGFGAGIAHLCDVRPDRFRRALRLHCNRHGMQSCLPLVRGSQGRTILVAQRFAVSVADTMVLEEAGPRALKTLTRPVIGFNVPTSGGGATISPPSK
jgi:hypothetical protein